METLKSMHDGLEEMAELLHVAAALFAAPFQDASTSQGKAWLRQRREWIARYEQIAETKIRDYQSLGEDQKSKKYDMGAAIDYLIRCHIERHEFTSHDATTTSFRAMTDGDADRACEEALEHLKKALRER